MSRLRRADLQVDAVTTARMRAVRQQGTVPELKVRQLVRALGVRYRIQNKDLPGSPDLANRRAKWAVFVHGCFWHAHAGCAKATVPKRNRQFWLTKLDANRARDNRALRALRRQGFKAVVVWECQLREPKRVVARLGSQLSKRSVS